MSGPSSIGHLRAPGAASTVATDCASAAPPTLCIIRRLEKRTPISEILLSWKLRNPTAVWARNQSNPFQGRAGKRVARRPVIFDDFGWGLQSGRSCGRETRVGWTNATLVKP